MAHAELAEDCQVKQTLIPDNGSAICFSEDKADIIGHAPVGLLTHEGGEVVDLQSDHLLTPPDVVERDGDSNCCIVGIR